MNEEKYYVFTSRNVSALYGNRKTVTTKCPHRDCYTIKVIHEKVIHSQLYDYLPAKNVFSKAQFGFRKHHSTTTCMLKLLDQVYNNMDRGWLTGVVFLDLKKAFDTIDHAVLLSKLLKYGVCHTAVRWFENFYVVGIRILWYVA